MTTGESTDRGASVAGGPIQFTIVTAVHNVGRYLDDFIESVEGQRFPRDRFEVIAVDDGSTDDSLGRLRAWEAERPGLVRILTQENAGQASARNRGLEHVRGEWVTFTDPDDVLGADYLAEVAAFLEAYANPPPSMVATNRLILDDASGRVTNSHPLRRHFAHGNRMRDLNRYPEYFHGSAPAGFFPAKELRLRSLRFDEQLRPTWEDGHFCSRYLLDVDRPVIGFVASAHYRYRKRQDQSSTLQGSFADPGRFTTVLERGFLDALETGAKGSPTGRAPEWLQNFVIYELSWYFSSEEAHAGVQSAAVGAVSEQFHRLMERIVSRLDPDVIAGFSVRPMKAAWTDILLHGYEKTPWRQPFGYASSHDADRGLVRVSYRYTGPAPPEELLSGGLAVPPAHGKVRSLRYQGQVMMQERIVWLSSRRSVRLRVDGRDLDLQFTLPRRRLTLRPGEIKQRLGRQPVGPRPARRPTRLVDRMIRWLARTRIVRRLLRGSWVLMDRIGDAGDSGERLFDYLRSHRDDVNAWFVIARGAPDWARLRRRHGHRVLAHGSLRWKLVMANCRHLISSHIDVPIIRPPELDFLRPAWRFTFLQHGVIKDDLSGWLNPKPIDLLVTSTPHEYASIAGDHTPYVFTTKEVKLTGLPRFDRLRELGQRIAPLERNLVLVAPTWRVRLVQPLQAGEHRRAIAPEFLDSEFAQNWLGLLSSPELATSCAEMGLTIGFLPHPVLQPALPLMNLPANVLPLTFADHDVQELFARSAVMVTDYSSMAFNAAYIDRPLVYFQFDADRVQGGEHLGRRGYFEYERDGFGPVTRTLPEAVRAITDVLRSGREPSALYQARIDAAFPARDGRCCERVTEEIERLTHRLSPEDAAVPTPTPNRPPVITATPTG